MKKWAVIYNGDDQYVWVVTAPTEMEAMYIFMLHAQENLDAESMKVVNMSVHPVQGEL